MDPFLTERANGTAPEFKTTINGADVTKFDQAEMQIETPVNDGVVPESLKGINIRLSRGSAKSIRRLIKEAEAAAIAKIYSLVIKYLRELEVIKGEPRSSFESVRDEARGLLNHPEIKWHWLFDGERTLDNLCGFLAIGFRDNCHPDCDYFISQTYVEPGHRRKGLMSAFFKQWLDEHKGATLCMFIIDNNEIAKKFWLSLMPSIGYEPMYLTEVLPPDGYTTQYGWRPKRD